MGRHGAGGRCGPADIDVRRALGGRGRIGGRGPGVGDRRPGVGSGCSGERTPSARPAALVSKRAEITWSIRPWKNPVVPLAVELRLLHVQPFHNLVWDFYSCWIDLRIKASLDSQSGFGCGI